MSEVDLRESLIATLRYLLKSKEDIELQICKAKEIINLSCEQSIGEEMRPISIEQDAIWLNYLLGLLGQAKSDIELVKNALSQLGVLNLDHLSSNLTYLNVIESQGNSALDFSS